jgi:hypothetical protein
VEAMSRVPPTSHSLDRHAVKEASAAPSLAALVSRITSGRLRPMQYAPAGVEPLHGLRHSIRSEIIFFSIVTPVVTLCRQLLLLDLQFLGSSRSRKEVLPLRGLLLSIIRVRYYHCAGCGICRVGGQEKCVAFSHPRHLLSASFSLQFKYNASSYLDISFVHCDECGHCINRETLTNGLHLHKPGRFVHLV